MRIKIIIMQDRYLCLTLHESNTAALTLIKLNTSPCLPYLFAKAICAYYMSSTRALYQTVSDGACYIAT